MKRWAFGPEFKAKVVLAVLTGQKSRAYVFQENNLKPKLPAHWKAKLLERAKVVFESEEREKEGRSSSGLQS